MRCPSLFLLSVVVSTVTATENQDTNSIRTLSTNIEKFSTTLFKEIAKTKNGKNYVMSPLSTDFVLAMAAYGASGNTAKQMYEVLNLPADDSVAHQGFQDLIQNFNTVKDGKAPVELGIKLYLAKDFELKDNFTQLTSNVFQSVADKMDISHPKEVADEVNNWIQNKTHGKISKIIDEEDINSDTRLLLLNTVYFKDEWNDRFSADNTQNVSFSLNKRNQKIVPFMHRDAFFNYGNLSDLNAEFVELPFASDKLKMVIIVPHDEEGLTHVIDNVESFNSSRLDESGRRTHVDLFLPKFKIENDIGLKEALINIGMMDAFNDSADFTNISEKKLKIDNVLQKATIDVNEGGCEAVAATFAQFSMMSALTVVKVDKPFLFKIVDGNTDATIFMGTVVEP